MTRYEKQLTKVNTRNVDETPYRKFGSIVTSKENIKNICFNEVGCTSTIHLGHIGIADHPNNLEKVKSLPSISIEVTMTYDEINERNVEEIWNYLRREVLEVLERAGLYDLTKFF